MSVGLSGNWGAFVDWRRVALWTVLAGVPVASLPFVVSEYIVHVMAFAAYYVILAASWNLLAGFTGQFSLAHHAFAAVGGYTSGLLIYHLQIPVWLSVPSGIIAAGLAGLLIGILVLKMRAIYLSIATWAFAETFRILLTAGYEFTRGDLGLSVPSLYGHVRPIVYYYTFAIVAGLCLLIMHVILKSPAGYFMRAIKDDQMRAASLGVDTTRVKLFAFVVSSAMAGLAGVLNAHYVLTLTPSIVDFSEMAKIIVMVAIGGMGSFLGPVIATPPIHFLTAYLTDWGEWSMVIFASIVIVLMRAQPGGLAAVMAAVIRRRGTAAQSAAIKVPASQP